MPLLRPFNRPFDPPRLPTAATPSESLRIERVIAVSRLVLTIIAIGAAGFSGSSGPPDTALGQILLGLFVAHSLSAVIVLRTRQRTTLGFALTTHTVDVLAAVLTLPTATSTNSFFGFFLFALAAAAFRWGFRETVMTTVAAFALVFVMARAATADPAWALGPTGATRPVETTLLEAGYLAVLGLLLGRLAEEGRLVRAEAAAVAGLLSRVRAHVGVDRALAAIAKDTVKVFNAAQLLLVIEDLNSHRLFRWDTRKGWSVTAMRSNRTLGLDRESFFFGPDDLSFAVVRSRWPWLPNTSEHITAVDATGRTVRTPQLPLPESFTAAYPFRQLIVAPTNFGDGWAGRTFVFDPYVALGPAELARFLRTIAQQVGPAVFNVFLLGRLRAQAGAIERARVARELHDGVIQSLISAEMQLQVLQTRPDLQDSPVAADLLRLQTLVRREVVSLRELMQQMRPVEFDPEELLDYLAATVERFTRDTGIVAHFSSDLRHVALPRHVCAELVRIVQEALVNVRKHSAATHVVVRLGQRDGFWMLEVDDDGRGFPFEGRLGPVELESHRNGPIIIKERVRAIGGQLAIDSRPGRGSRLEVLVPQEARG